jgi:small subunit ribosomal protein S16
VCVFFCVTNGIALGATKLYHRLRDLREGIASMIKLRLRRTGAKKKPSYRIVVADARSKRDGRFIEIVGQYNPLTDPSTIVLDNDRARYWLSQGAQPTERVAKLLKIQGVTDTDGKIIAAPATEAAESAS